MSEYIYLLGAGASRGKRNSDAKGLDKYLEGMPVINEIPAYLSDFCQSFRPRYVIGGVDMKIDHPYVYKEMCWLCDIAKDNSTIDTYANMLYSSSKVSELIRFKRALAIFFSLIQSREKRDKRYDSLMANIHDSRGKIRSDVSIFTWNYDRQLEYALHAYEQSKTSSTHQLKYSNISCKFLTDNFIDYNDSNVIKLNGTASFKSVEDSYLFQEDEYDIDVFERILRENDTKWVDGISYAWEEANEFYNKILPLTSDTETLIIIGYSMPIVNCVVDKKLLDGMKNLKSVIIQDLNPDDVKKRLLDLLSPDIKKNVEGNIRTETNITEFFVPVKLFV